MLPTIVDYCKLVRIGVEISLGEYRNFLRSGTQQEQRGIYNTLHITPINFLSARIFTVFRLKLKILEGKVLQNEAWVAALLGTLLEYEKVNFPCIL